MAQIVNDEIWPDAYQLYDSLATVTLPENIAGDQIAELDVAIICGDLSADAWYEEAVLPALQLALRLKLHLADDVQIRMHYGSHMFGPQTPNSVEIQFWLKPGFEKPPIISQRGIDHGIGQN